MTCSSAAAGASRRVAMPWLDRLALGASAACLFHCLFLPLLLAASPALTRMLDLPEAFHIYAFLAAVPISALAMRSGYARHGLLLPASLGLAGIAMLGIGALAGLSGLLETGVTLVGSVLLALAHIRNWQLRSLAHRRATQFSNDNHQGVFDAL